MRPRDDVHGNQFADSTSSRRAGVRGRLYRRHIAAMKRVSAFVNQCYVISANIGQYGHQRAGSPAPAPTASAGSSWP